MASASASNSSSSAPSAATSGLDIASASASSSAGAAPVSSIDLSPALFGGFDICLRDVEGTNNVCGQKFGFVREPGASAERWCRLEAHARTALVEARAAMQKVNPDLELLIVSSYRPPAYQQCLWLQNGGDGKKGAKCLSSVCGPRDAAGKALPCKKYDLDDPKFAHVFDHCQHVDMRAVDVCAYSKSKVTLDAHGSIDLALIDDCAASADPKHVLQAGHYYHPCGCRHTGWTKDIHSPTARTKIFKNGGPGEQLVMMRALHDAGFSDDVSNEWWHFAFRK